MNKVFLDTNVLLDFLLDREPYASEVAEIFEASISNEIQLCVSSVSITDAVYIMGRAEGFKTANRQTKRILKLVTVESVGETTVIKSSNSKFTDFEDGVQNFCAIEAGHSIIVTRNVKDFKQSKLSIMTPREFLVKLKNH